MKQPVSPGRDIILILVFSVLSLAVYALPTGFEDRVEERALRCKAVVLKVDDSDVRQFGLVRTGDQRVQLRIASGPHKGTVFHASNPLLGRMDKDKIFRPGDTALVVLSLNEKNEVVFVNPQDHYRIDLELLLLAIFALALIVFAGWTGARALLSFVFAGLMLWKVLVPLMLKGHDPILVSLGVVAILTGGIIFLVGGIGRKGLTAFLGAFLGVLTSCLMALYFTREFQVHGAVMPFAETLLYSGFGHLNLTKIYIAAVFIAASGAVMDLAMDVSASMSEVVAEKPDITRMDLIRSGLSVGRVVVGTMTTTLLLAYSGGYITLLMAFMAQGVPVINIFNLIYVSTEVLKTLVGSFGMVMVAPFTAFIGGFILKGAKGADVRS